MQFFAKKFGSKDCKIGVGGGQAANEPKNE